MGFRNAEVMRPDRHGIPEHIQNGVSSGNYAQGRSLVEE